MSENDNQSGVSKCTAAVVNDYGVTSACLEATLEKLNKKQDTFTEAINKESEKLNVGRDEHKIEHMISITNIYRSKLDKIKDEMGNLSSRSMKLRQRAARLQEEKQKESMEREIQRDKERIREKELIAKPASSYFHHNCDSKYYAF